MNSTGSYIFPFILAAAVHALVVAALIVKWPDKADLETARLEPYYIDAALVAENPYKARERAAAQAAARELARRQQAARRTQLERDKAEKARLEALRKEEDRARREKELEAERQALAQQQADETRDAATLEAERKNMEQGLAMAVQDEQEYRKAVTDDEKAMAYVAQIQREIVQNWSRPPSARNGMEALLKVHLVPTGEVVDVALVKSSGNDAFDRSAVLAVQKAGRFMVPSDSSQFERNFRQFEVLFRPEDLRL